MQRRSAAFLWDLTTAAKRIQGFVAGKSWNDYSHDLLLRSGVERQFEIAGEAMNALRRVDPETAERVPNVHRIIGMRNVLIHGYAEVNNLTVWRAATENLDEVVTQLMRCSTRRGARTSTIDPLASAHRLHVILGGMLGAGQGPRCTG